MSRNSPCGRSSATSGVKRSHQSAISFERLAVGGFVRVIDGEFGTDGARIGERQANGKTGANRRLVDGIEKNGVVVFGDDDTREVTLPCVATRNFI